MKCMINALISEKLQNLSLEVYMEERYEIINLIDKYTKCHTIEMGEANIGMSCLQRKNGVIQPLQ